MLLNYTAANLFNKNINVDLINFKLIIDIIKMSDHSETKKKKKKLNTLVKHILLDGSVC